VEQATLRKVDRTWDLAPWYHANPFALAHAWYGLKEANGVRMLRSEKYIIFCPHLHYFTKIHHCYMRGHVIYHGKIMGYKQIGKGEVFL